MAKKNVTLKDEASNELNPETVITQVKDSSNAALFTEASGTISTTSGHTINGASITDSSITSDKLGTIGQVIFNIDQGDANAKIYYDTSSDDFHIYANGCTFYLSGDADKIIDGPIEFDSDVYFNNNDLNSIGSVNTENLHVTDDVEIEGKLILGLDCNEQELYNVGGLTLSTGQTLSFQEDWHITSIDGDGYQNFYLNCNDGIPTFTIGGYNNVTTYQLRPDSIYKKAGQRTSANTYVDLIPHLYCHNVEIDFGTNPNNNWIGWVDGQHVDWTTTHIYFKFTYYDSNSTPVTSYTDFPQIYSLPATMGVLVQNGFRGWGAVTLSPTSTPPTARDYYDAEGVVYDTNNNKVLYVDTNFDNFEGEETIVDTVVQIF